MTSTTAHLNSKTFLGVLISQELVFDECVPLILAQGVDSMLAGILGSADQATVLASFQKLCSQHPPQEYKCVAEDLPSGDAINKRQKPTRTLGFQPPSR